MEDSEKTLAQKTIVEGLNKDLERFEMIKGHLSSFLFKDKNFNSPNYSRAQVAVKKVKDKIADLELQMKVADEIWFGFQLEDLEAALSE